MTVRWSFISLQAAEKNALSLVLEHGIRDSDALKEARRRVEAEYAAHRKATQALDQFLLEQRGG